jgi:dolichol-phosphate mannosyltransferase
MKILILLPTYNESESLPHFLPRLKKVLEAFPEVDVLNIDDASPDGTAEVFASANLPRSHQISRPGKEGLGQAYRSGFLWGLAHGYDFFVEMDSDCSHQPEELPRLLARLDQRNLIIGTRWMEGGLVQNWPWYRRAISRAGTEYASWALHVPFRDLTSGYRVLSRDFLSSLDLEPVSSVQSRGYGFQIEMAMKALENGFTIVEVPITFIERVHGRSKMTAEIAWEAMVLITRWGVARRLSGKYRR